MSNSYYSEEDDFEHDDESWEKAKQDYLEELEELGWDWDAWDPCH